MSLAGLETTLDIGAKVLALVALILVILVYRKLRTCIIECRPWKFMFIGLIIFAAKKLSLLLTEYGILYIPSTLFNVIIISFFIYAILVEIDIVKKLQNHNLKNTIKTDKRSGKTASKKSRKGSNKRSKKSKRK